MSVRSDIERLRGAMRDERRAQALLDQAREIDRRAVQLVADAIEQGQAPDALGDELLTLHRDSGRRVQAALRLTTRARGLTAEEMEPMASTSPVTPSDAAENEQEIDDAAHALAEWTGCDVSACRAYMDALVRVPRRAT
jgi:hypothetical protein